MSRYVFFVQTVLFSCESNTKCKNITRYAHFFFQAEPFSSKSNLKFKNVARYAQFKWQSRLTKREREGGSKDKYENGNEPHEQVYQKVIKK